MHKGKELTFVDGVHAAMPTMLGYAGIAFSLGVVASSISLSPMEMLLMSLLLYAGSGQFILCSMIALQAPISAIAVTIFMVNLRHLMMGFSASSSFSHLTLFQAVGIGSLLTDESYGVLMLQRAKGVGVSISWMNGLNVASYFSWMTCSVLGVFAGKLFPSPKQFGLDYALIGMFIGLFVLQFFSQIKEWKKYVLIIASVWISLFLLLSVVSVYLAVILASILGCVIGVCIDERI
ncbi:Predicted branched-chain amino acid permease (azaleucine resistance) [Pilibacter termitis]|uniref:Predicted branched-chain amino acid permease (Azaleucine resistance) n=1 Tax=Pilibacter termitis TaxID=263852 RepID=A0A1T4NQ16_9ENTE|nr:AzlC family ABC transporter permease [Pilibacter termitis]SJZ81411.1 Predicted branched-chain amino acid permease (azaleucine resistance) [Pilibacter termitis]